MTKIYAATVNSLYEDRKEVTDNLYPIFEAKTAPQVIDLDDIEGLINSGKLCKLLSNVIVDNNAKTGNVLFNEKTGG